MKFSLRVALIGVLVALGANLTSTATAQNAPEDGVSDLPILGLAQVTFKVSDMEKSRAFYGGILGYPEAFRLRDPATKAWSIYYKINDDQFVELVPGLRTDELVREPRIAIEAADLRKLRAIYVERGLSPTPIKKGVDGNPVFRIVAPNGYPFDFLQYAPNSQQSKLRGKLLTSERISTKMLHSGTFANNDAMRDFVQNKLGFGRRLPGGRGDYVEILSFDRNRETKNPPLDGNNPATFGQFVREVYGAVYHWALIVPDIRATRDYLQKRGGYDDVRVRTAVGNNRRWLLHVYDPDGTRVEIMSADLVPNDIPSFSVMQPGPNVGPPIPPKSPGVYAWP